MELDEAPATFLISCIVDFGAAVVVLVECVVVLVLVFLVDVLLVVDLFVLDFLVDVLFVLVVLVVECLLDVCAAAARSSMITSASDGLAVSNVAIAVVMGMSASPMSEAPVSACSESSWTDVWLAYLTAMIEICKYLDRLQFA